MVAVAREKDAAQERADVFVGLRYHDRRPDLERAIENAFRGSPFRLRLADEEVRDSDLLDKIRSMILDSPFCIFDLTEANQTVLLELGIAHGAGKQYYILSAEGSQLPPVLSGRDGIRYRNFEHLRVELKAKIVAIEQERFHLSRGAAKDVARLEELPLEAVLGPEVRATAFPATKLQGHAGLFEDRPDPTATTKAARFSKQSTGLNHIVFGPYLPTSIRRGVAFFRLKVDSFPPDSDLLLLDVIGGGYASRAIRSEDLRRPGEYQTFAVPFETTSHRAMEYRVMPLRAELAVWIDTIVVAERARLPL